jgi:hypothetical protein
MPGGRWFCACSPLPSSPPIQFKFYLKQFPRNTTFPSANPQISRAFLVQRTFRPPRVFNHLRVRTTFVLYGFSRHVLFFLGLARSYNKNRGEGVPMFTRHSPVLAHLAPATGSGRSFSLGGDYDDDAALGGNSGLSGDGDALAFASRARCRLLGSLESPASVVWAC